MEEENKKARKVARREYIDDVRELVMFVRKRDKRVAKHQAEEAVRRAQKQVRCAAGGSRQDVHKHTLHIRGEAAATAAAGNTQTCSFPGARAD